MMKIIVGCSCNSDIDCWSSCSGTAERSRVLTADVTGGTSEITDGDTHFTPLYWNAG